MPKIILIISSISGLFSVALGAFGAHALKAKLEAEGTLSTYHTAVQYQFYHTFALLAVGILMTRYSSVWLDRSAYSFILGIVLFSGSLYALVFTGIKSLGAVTPIGGLAFILAWAFLIQFAVKQTF